MGRGYHSIIHTDMRVGVLTYHAYRCALGCAYLCARTDRTSRLHQRERPHPTGHNTGACWGRVSRCLFVGRVSTCNDRLVHSSMLGKGNSLQKRAGKGAVIREGAFSHLQERVLPSRKGHSFTRKKGGKGCAAIREWAISLQTRAEEGTAIREGALSHHFF